MRPKLLALIRLSAALAVAGALAAVAIACGGGGQEAGGPTESVSPPAAATLTPSPEPTPTATETQTPEPTKEPSPEVNPLESVNQIIAFVENNPSPYLTPEQWEIKKINVLEGFEEQDPEYYGLLDLRGALENGDFGLASQMLNRNLYIAFAGPWGDEPYTVWGLEEIERIDPERLLIPKEAFGDAVANDRIDLAVSLVIVKYALKSSSGR